MVAFTVKTGYDAYVAELQPTLVGYPTSFPRVRDGNEFRTLLFMPLNPAQIKGKTVLSATLSCAVHANWVAQTITVRTVAADWNVATINWNTKPSVRVATATQATGALSSGARFGIDVTALVQAFADGSTNYGFELRTSQSTDASLFRGFRSGLGSWILTVEVSDVIPRPSQLSPEGVIGTDLPTLSFDDVDDLAQAQIQIDAASDTASPDYDTGWVATTTPQIDMSDTFPSGLANLVSDTTYNGLTDGTATNWRVRVKTANNSTSAWSDWVAIEHDAPPTIVMDNPSGTDLWDPNPSIAAHLSPAGDADTRWRVIVTEADDPATVRYDSGDAISGATLDLQLPLKYKRRLVFPADRDYRLEVRAWDRADRVPVPGVPSFAREVVTVTLDTEATETAPVQQDLTQAASGYPDVTVHWTRASDPDRFVIRRNGEVIARVFPDDVRVSPGVFEWVDETAEPNTTHSYTIRAVTDVAGTMKQSVSSNIESIFATVEGLWVRSATDDVLLYGDGMDAAQVDKRQSFEMPYRAENVDIITAVGGIVGSYAGVVDRRSSDLDADLAQLEEWRQAPETELRLVWGTHNIWATLSGLSVVQSPLTMLPSNLIYDVKFGFQQIDSRDD